MATEHDTSTSTSSAPRRGGVGGFLVRKLGPLPLWAWMGLALAALYAFFQWRAAHSTGQASTATADTSAVPDGNNPAPITQVYLTTTPSGSPPAGGRTGSPGGSPGGAPPAGGTDGSGSSGGGTLTDTPPSPPKGSGGSTKGPKPAGSEVTVTTFKEPHPAWNSTLAGIAEHEGYGSDWKAIWEAPANADLRKRRKTPTGIRPGDKIVVPPK